MYSCESGYLFIDKQNLSTKNKIITKIFDIKLLMIPMLMHLIFFLIIFIYYYCYYYITLYLLKINHVLKHK